MNGLRNLSEPFDMDKYRDLLGDVIKSAGGIANSVAQNPVLSNILDLAPDTYGCDRLFIEFFVKWEMMEDFPLIASEFFRHERESLQGREIVRYVNSNLDHDRPEAVFSRFVMNLMMNALDAGSEYTKNLILYLYKTYYKKEYKDLKRFGSISLEEVVDLARAHDELHFMNGSIARILFISKLSGKTIANDCNALYAMLNDYYKMVSNKDLYSFGDAVDERYDDCLEEVKGMEMDKLYNLDAKAEKFVGNTLKWLGYDPMFAEYCDEYEEGFQERLGSTLALLRKTYPGKKEFTKQELVLYGTIVHILQALVCNEDWFTDNLGLMVCGEVGEDFEEMENPRFHLENIKDVKEPPRRLPLADIKTKDAVEKNIHTDDADKNLLISEIEELRKKMHSLEGDNRALRSELAGRRKLQDENKSVRDELEFANRELAALRSHLYNMTEEEIEPEGQALASMKGELAKRKIVIIGGHANWVNKVKKEFPGWSFVNPTVSGTVDVSVVENADKIYFFTDILEHSTYQRYINVLRGKKRSFGYIHGVNLEKNIRQIYNEMMGK